VTVSAFLSASVVHPAAIRNHPCTSHAFVPHAAPAPSTLLCCVLTRQTISGWQVTFSTNVDLVPGCRYGDQYADAHSAVPALTLSGLLGTKKGASISATTSALSVPLHGVVPVFNSMNGQVVITPSSDLLAGEHSFSFTVRDLCVLYPMCSGNPILPQNGLEASSRAIIIAHAPRPQSCCCCHLTFTRGYASAGHESREWERGR